MKYLIFLLILLSLLSGCLNKKSIIRTSITGIAPEELQSTCSEINEIGNIWHLIQKVKLKTELAISLSQSGSPLEVLPKVSQLETEVSDLVDKVIKLARPQWTEEVSEIQATWKIGPKDFGYEDDQGLEITKVKTKYFTMNGKRISPSHGTVVVSKNGIASVITHSREANLLELCAFQSTFSILVDVEYSLPYNSESPITQGGHKLFLLGIN